MSGEAALFRVRNTDDPAIPQLTGDSHGPHPHHPRRIAAAQPAHDRFPLRARAGRTLRSGRVRGLHGGGMRGDGTPAGRGRGRRRLGRRDLQDFVRHLREGSLHGLLRRQRAQPAGGSEAFSTLPGTHRPGRRYAGVLPPPLHRAGGGGERRGAPGRHRQPQGRDGGARRATRLHERRVSGGHRAIPAERLVPLARCLSRCPRRRDEAGIRRHPRGGARSSDRLPRPGPVAPRAVRRAVRRGVRPDRERQRRGPQPRAPRRRSGAGADPRLLGQLRGPPRLRHRDG